MSSYEEISPMQASIVISADNALVLDIRDDFSYREECIDGAMLNHDGLMQSLLKKKEYDRPIIIYCYHGISSKDMAEFFCTLGFRRVYSLEGGYVAWKKWRIPYKNSTGTTLLGVE